MAAAFIYNCAPGMEPTGLVTLEARGTWQGIIHKGISVGSHIMVSVRPGIAMQRNVTEWEKPQRDGIGM